MQRSYWRALVGQLRASLHEPVGIILGILGAVGIPAAGVLAGFGKLHGWPPVAITAAVVLAVANYVGLAVAATIGMGSVLTIDSALRTKARDVID
jgi:phage shock protein PspC (stress-responsive transcriptional regulator)